MILNHGICFVISFCSCVLVLRPLPGSLLYFVLFCARGMLIRVLGSIKESITRSHPSKGEIRTRNRSEIALVVLY